jgi:hypothetical protein
MTLYKKKLAKMFKKINDYEYQRTAVSLATQDLLQWISKFLTIKHTIFKFLSSYFTPCTQHKIVIYYSHFYNTP